MICCGSRLCAVAARDHQHADLAEVRMRNADQRTFGHTGQIVDVALDLGRIHVVAATDDQVLAASDDGHIAIRVDAADVAGLEEAVGGEFLAGLLRHVPVALEHVGPAHLDAADLALRARPRPASSCTRSSTPGKRKTDRAAAALAARRVAGVGRQHRRLRHAVALQNGVAGALLPLREGVEQQRRRARDEQAHVAALLRIRAPARPACARTGSAHP